MKIGSWVRAVALDELEGPGPFALSVKGVDVVVVRTRDGLRAFDGRCPHQGALLGEGEFDGETLVCRNHRWRFAVDSGRRDGGPQCLASCPVDVRDGALYFDVSGLSRKMELTAPKRDIEHLPGPKGLPILGNLHQIKPAQFHLILERWAVQFGSPYLFHVPGRRIVVVTDPKWADQALRARPETFRRSVKTAEILGEMGIDGVFIAEGEAWRPQRKLSVAALAQRHFRALYPSIEMVTTRLLSRWRKLADAGEALDLVDEMKRFTVDVTTLMTFGYDINTIEQDDDLIQRKLDLVFPAIVRRLLAPFPTWRYLRLPKDRQLDKAVAELRDWLGELIARTKELLAREPERAGRPSNFIEAMLVARDDDGKPFPERVIFGNLMTMLLAGEDTTANTLAWAVHELFDHPQWMGELRREAGEVLGSSEVAGSVDQANALESAGAVANETMRLRPVAPFNIVQAIADTTVGDLRVPKGTLLAFLTRAPATAPIHFEAPKAFRPERWLTPVKGAHNAAVHIPFGSGPRICPGRALALVEMNTLLSMLYKNFDLERVGARDDVGEEYGFTMSPVGLQGRMRRREAAVAEMAMN